MWGPEGKDFEVHASLDVIESLGVEIMRGFGAVPKRGAEIGGILLGTIERDSATVVRVEDFQTVPCGYKRGPSFLLSPEEREVFDGAASDLAQGVGDGNYAVGYFRSNTRESASPSAEDTELMDHCFPGPSNVMLLVKPYATKASRAGFFFREGGEFQQTTPLEFPFRRRELLGEAAPERRPLMERRRRGEPGRTPPRPRQEPEPVAESEPSPPADREDADYAYAATLPPRSKLGERMWFPLSFIFLLLGVALGFWARGSSGMLGAASREFTGSPDYSLALAANRSGDSLTVQWDGDSPIIRNADRGVLEIHDGGYSKTVELDVAQLRSGKLAFQNASAEVSFHLTVYLNSRLSVSETLDWRPVERLP